MTNHGSSRHKTDLHPYYISDYVTLTIWIIVCSILLFQKMVFDQSSITGDKKSIRPVIINLFYPSFILLEVY